MANKSGPSFVGTAPASDVELGRVQLAPEVLEVIIGIATAEVDGVVHTQGNFVSGVAAKLGKTVHGKGVHVEWADDQLTIDVYCVVRESHPVREIALEIQKQIRHAILHMTSLETKEVNVHITGILFDEESV